MVSSTTHVTPVPEAPRGRYDNAAEWWHELGEVPLERIIMSPWPGSATEADLLRLVEREDRLCELIDGTLVEKPVGLIESLIAIALATALSNFIRPRKLGLVAGADAILRMLSTNIRLPDVAFISLDDLPGGVLPRQAVPRLPVRIAAEVISQSNTKAEMRKKLGEYFESGSCLVWFIYPNPRTVAIYLAPTDEPAQVLNESDTLTGGDVLPGFEMPVAELFTSVPRN